MTTHRDLLQGVTLRSLTWLHEHLPHFRLPADFSDAGDHNMTLKPLGELARLGLSIRRASPPGGRAYQLASGLVDFAWGELRAGQVLYEASRAEPQASYPLEVYAAFPGAGLHHAGFEELTRFLSGTRAWAALELEPTRELAVLAGQRALGIAPRTDTEAAMRRTWLGHRPEPWMFEVLSGYALTHYVFHVTDWGGEPGRMPGEVGDHLDLWLPAWLDCCLEEEQWDLSGELLAVAASLPRPPRLAEAWGALALAQEPSGALPETGHLADTGDTGDTAGKAAFRSRYHSTLVMAFAGSLAAARLGEEGTHGADTAGSVVTVGASDTAESEGIA